MNALGRDAMLKTEERSASKLSFFQEVYDESDIRNLSAMMARIRDRQDRLTDAVREQQSLVIANQKLVYRGTV